MVHLTFGLLLLKNMVPQAKEVSEEVTLQPALRPQVTEHQDSVHHPDQFLKNMVPQPGDRLFPKVMVPQVLENLPLVHVARLTVLLGTVFHSPMVHRLHVPSPLLMEPPMQEVWTLIPKDLNLHLHRIVPQVQEVFLTLMELRTQEVFRTPMALRTQEVFLTPMALRTQEVCLTLTALRMQEVFLTRTELRTQEVYRRSMVRLQAELQD